MFEISVRELSMRKPNPAKRQQWAERLDHFEASELTVSQFCLREGVSIASFYQWRRKLRGKSGGNEPKRFQPVQLTSAAAAMTVRLRDGIVIEVAADAIESVLAQLLRSDEGGSSC